MQKEHFTAHFMESEYLDYVEVVGGKQGYSTSGHKHNHPISSTATITSALIVGTLDTEDDAQKIFATPGQVVFPETTIAVHNTEAATASTNGSTSSNTSIITTSNNTHLTMDQQISETLPVLPLVMPIETEKTDMVNAQDDIAISQDNSNINQDSNSGVTTYHNNSSILLTSTSMGTPTHNPEVEHSPIPDLKHKCHVSIKKLDD